jgi:cytochrome d ubiquinol oxidase subunit I
MDGQELTLILSRIQFAFTISFHIIFPAFTIGLASFLAVLEGLYLYTNKKLFLNLYKFWVKIFALSFAFGVVSGIVMSYQFGTNWAELSIRAGNILGPLLGYEVLTAFFLEASFLGIMLFGIGRVSKNMHFASTVIVAVGTLISAFWILSANSWMQTPQGIRIDDNGILLPVSWLDIVFNPSFPYRFIHMIIACYLTTAFVVLGTGAYYILRKKFVNESKVMMIMALSMVILAAPTQIVMGDMHGLNTLKHQPVKVSAMEGLWETEKGAGLKLFGWPDTETETTKYAIEIPKLASLILTHDLDGEVKGLKHWDKSERPPVAIVFFAFRIMVSIGMLMLLTAALGLLLLYRKTLFTNRHYLQFCRLMTPTGFIALLSGWIVTEVGRQPYVIYGILKTKDAISPSINYIQSAISLGCFVLIYTLIFGAGLYYLFKLVEKGPEEDLEIFGSHSFTKPQPLINIFRR